jgi:hypothetical protein
MAITDESTCRSICFAVTRLRERRPASVCDPSPDRSPAAPDDASAVDDSVRCTPSVPAPAAGVAMAVVAGFGTETVMSSTWLASGCLKRVPGACSVGALAVGALAVGALAVGALWSGSLSLEALSLEPLSPASFLSLEALSGTT